MLEIIEVKTPEQKQIYLDTFDPQRQTWLVSDLRTKFEIQSRLFQFREVLEEDAILRASELWNKFIVRLFPDLHLVSKDVALTLLTLWLREEKFNWSDSPGAAESLYSHMQQMLPLLVQTQARNQMPEWFQQNPKAALRWEAWWELGIRSLARFIDSGLFPAAWGQALLVERDLSPQWKRDLIVDLNGEITPLEAEILWQLSRYRDVKVLFPFPQWIQAFEPSFQGYFHLYDHLQRSRPRLQEPEFKARQDVCKVLRFSSQAAEVKNAVSQIRRWLDEGVELERIAILAPEIEDFWPILKVYLDQEGIPCAKDRIAPLQSFLPMQKWLSRLRLGVRKIETEDLESDIFSQDEPLISYEKFKVLYTHIFDEEDLAREENIRRAYTSEQSGFESFQRDEFLKWTLRFFQADDEEAWLDQVFPGLLNEIPAHLAMPLKDWIYLLESRISKKEVLQQKGSLAGLSLVNLSSSEWLEPSHVIVLGLHEEAMKTRESTSLTQKDVSQLFEDLGVVINPAENHNLEFEVLWFMEKSAVKSLILSTSETDFSGSVTAPSLVWLLMAGYLNPEQTTTVSLPGPTRWDEIENMLRDEWRQLRQIPEHRYVKLAARVEGDLGNTLEPSEAVDLDIGLSASRLESFAQCPYTFKAEKLFRLTDFPELDLDMDHMSRGVLIHQVLKRIIEAPDFLNLTPKQLEDIIDQSRRELKLPLVDERLWPSLRAQTLSTALQFLEDEKNWRETYQVSRTPGRELGFQMYLCLDREELSKTEISSIRISGQIDRVDELQDGSLVILDYKTSMSAKHRNWKKWITSPEEIQLALYAFVVEMGYTELNAHVVSGSLYYGLKQRLRQKGFALADSVLQSLPGRDNKIRDEEKQELYQKLKDHLLFCARQVRQGALDPSPLNEEYCATCNWRTQCRAPHLN